MGDIIEPIDYDELLDNSSEMEDNSESSEEEFNQEGVGEDGLSENQEQEVEGDSEEEEREVGESEESEESEDGQDGEGEESDEEESGDIESDEIDEEKMRKWAEENGFIKKEDIEKEKENRNEEKPSQIQRPSEISEEAWNGMGQIDKFIYTRLPYIEAVGKDGNVIKVKTPDQLPDDFEFVSKRAEKVYDNQMFAQELRARDIDGAIRERAQVNMNQVKEVEVARQKINDIKSLQKEGILPVEKVKPEDKGWDNDSAVQLINEVLKYQDDRAKEGRWISVYDAGLIYKAIHPEKFEVGKEAKKSVADKERKEVSKRINRGVDGRKGGRDSMPVRSYPGLSAVDIADLVGEDLD